MERLLEVLNTLGNDGNVKTYFDGAVTQSQLFLGIGCILLVAFIIINIKHIIKTLVSGLLLVGVGICVFMASPTQLTDMSEKLQDNEMIQYCKQLSSTSENIKFEKDNVSINLGGTWYSLDDVKSYVNISEDSISINVNGQNIQVTDANVKMLLEKFSK